MAARGLRSRPRNAYLRVLRWFAIASLAGSVFATGAAAYAQEWPLFLKIAVGLIFFAAISAVICSAYEEGRGAAA